MSGTGSYEHGGRPRAGLLVGDWERAIAPRGGLSATPLDRMYRPDADSIAELRRQQVEFAKEKRRLDRENAWLAVPALAPVAVVGALEAGAAVAARMAPAVIKRPPLVLTERMPYLRVGDNWATRAGRPAHAELGKKIAQKAGWRSEPKVPLKDGGFVRPDVRTPARVRAAGQGPKPYQMELKPNTPSGRRAAEKALEKYQGTDAKTRAIFYDLKKFI